MGAGTAGGWGDAGGLKLNRTTFAGGAACTAGGGARTVTVIGAGAGGL